MDCKQQSRRFGFGSHRKERELAPFEGRRPVHCLPPAASVSVADPVSGTYAVQREDGTRVERARDSRVDPFVRCYAEAAG